MKNLISAIILCLFCWFATDAQTINACSYNKAVTVYDKINSDPSSQENSEAIRIIDRLVKPIGLPSNFIPVKIDGIENCAAITKNGLRFIVYDNVFLQALSSYDNKDWIKLSIFAHEIGHHLSGHTLYNSTSNEEQRTNELQADKFSGFLLQKLGASIEQATKGISILGDINDSNTHPAKGKRINAITQGYNEAENQENSIVSKREPSAEKFYYEALVSYHQLLIDSNYIDVGVNSFSKFRSSADKLKLEKMEENLSTAIKLNSNFTQAYKLRAGVRMLRDNVDGSERDLKEVLLFDSRNIDALTEFAVIEIRKQNFKSALNYLEKALIYNPNDPHPYLIKGIVFSQMGKHEEAINTYSSGLKVNKNYSMFYYNRGLSYKKLNKIDEAKEDFLQDVALDPKHSASYYYLGNIYLNNRNYDYAIDAYSNAINTDNNNAHLLYCRGYAFAQTKKIIEAKSDFKKSIVIDPKYFSSHFELGRIYLAEENYQEALKAYNNAIELKPDDGRPYNYRGEIYVALSNRTEALKDFNKSIELMPDYPFPYINRGFFFFEDKDYKQAVPDLDKGYNLDPFGGMWLKVIWTKGYAKYQIGDYEGAYNDLKYYIDFLERAMKMENNHVREDKYLAFTLGKAYYCAAHCAQLLKKEDEMTILKKGCDFGVESCCKILGK